MTDPTSHQPSDSIGRIELSNLKLQDYEALLQAMKAAYPDWPGGFWTLATMKRLIDKFPEGQFVIKADGKVVGSALAIIVQYSHFGDSHTYKQITDNYTFDTHDPNGDVLYGVDVFIHPDYRGLRLGRRLYDARKDLCERLNLKAIVFGGRIPNYHKFVDEMSPRDYIRKVKLREIYDPVLTFQLANDFHVKKVLRAYMPEDEESQEFACLLQWDNVYYESKHRTVTGRKDYARVGLIQWQMRSYSGLDEMFEQIEYFIDAVSAYKSDFALLPELFNAPLLASYNHLSEAMAMRELAEYTSEIVDRFHKMAMSYNVNIITGSMPELVDGTLYNVGYICHRGGNTERYVKLHITPDETKFWGIKGGDIIRTFDTDAGRIGVLICYDVEFPELGRLLAEEGMQILFVPYLTDTQNAYMRVRCCAQARAIENECYVALTGSVGNLPKVENMDIQYSQSVVFTPSDFAFPSNAIKAEATPNTEMILVADLDLTLLNELHTYGAVRNLKDRRKDVYDVTRIKR